MARDSRFEHSLQEFAAQPIAQSWSPAEEERAVAISGGIPESLQDYTY
jgi:hypothetical protein